MKYLPLENYSKAWIFRHRELLIPEAHLEMIKPMTEQRSEQFWQQFISRVSSHPDHFNEAADGWISQSDNWVTTGLWQNVWESACTDLPDEVLDHLSEWEDNTTVYFCYQSDQVIETNWQVFRQHWKNFLFFDNGPLLLGRRRSQVVQFFDNGSFRLGNKPKQ